MPVMNLARITHGPYSLQVDYYLMRNTLVVTSANAETNEVFENEMLGDLNGKEKFNRDSVFQYVLDSWGKALPGYDARLGFIYSVDDLEIRKHLLKEEDYLDIKKRFPSLPRVHGSFNGGNEEDKYLRRVVVYAKSPELDIVTGKPKPGSKGETFIDNFEEHWFSKGSVPLEDIRLLAPAMADAVVRHDPSYTHYFDPIEADIWRKYGKPANKIGV